MAQARAAYMIVVAALLACFLIGCQSAGPQYARPLPPGARALRKLPADQWPPLSPALLADRADLLAAAQRSLAWFDKPSTQQYFPVEGVTHEHAHASVLALCQLLERGGADGEILATIRAQFDLYQSIGWDGRGTVLFTGYFTPIVKASRTRTGLFRYPLYRKPPDLVTDPVSGDVHGRRVDDRITAYPTRRQIESDPHRWGLAGQEIAWLDDRFTAYLVHLQGSAKIELTDGGSLHLGYAANNGHEYTSIAKLLIADGKLDPNRLSLPAVQNYFRANPRDLDRYLPRNDRFIFFKEYVDTNWPAGSLGFAVTAGRSVATDKSVFPRGGLVLVDAPFATPTGKVHRQHLVLDQDTGGAIRAPGRADLYFGLGPAAEKLAGHQHAEGKLYYLLLQRSRITYWRQQLEHTIHASHSHNTANTSLQP